MELHGTLLADNNAIYRCGASISVTSCCSVRVCSKKKKKKKKKKKQKKKKKKKEMERK